MEGMDSEGIPAWGWVREPGEIDPGDPLAIGVSLDALDIAGVCLHGMMVTRFVVFVCG